MRICDHLWLHFETPRLNCVRPLSPCLHFEPLNISSFTDPDPAFHLNVDPDPASQNNADPDSPPCLRVRQLFGFESGHLRKLIHSGEHTPAHQKHGAKYVNTVQFGIWRVWTLCCEHFLLP
jgi:hypothetical protein